MTKNKFGIGFLAIVMVISVILSGCGKKGEQDGKLTENVNEPTEIKIMTIFFTPEPPGDDDIVKKEIEKQSNTKLNISWVSSNNYEDKTNVTLASGDIPELMLVLNPHHPQIKTMAAQGAFWDLTSYINDYPNMSKFPKESWENTSIDGKNFGIPRVRPLEGSAAFPLVRKDWLDQLGLKAPTDMDELYEVMKAFTEQDPDGNKKKDTIGFSGFVTPEGMGTLGWVENVFNGSNGNWKLSDGKLIDTTLEEGTRESLIWLNKAFKEGLIAPDFPTLKHSQVREMITTNKAGIFADAMKPSWLLTGQMRKTNSEADVLPLAYLEGPFGKFVPKDTGAYGMYVIPKTVSESKMKKILEFMDYGATEQGMMLASFGFKDVHYTVENDVIIPTEQASKDNVGVFSHLFANLDKYERGYQTGIPADFLKRNKEIIDERAKHSIPNPAFGLHSDTAVKVGNDYAKKIQDKKVKIIMGREPITAWDEFVEKLKADPQYQKIIAEVNEDYNKKQLK